jgi:hypothetical protein
MVCRELLVYINQAVVVAQVALAQTLVEQE